MKRAALVRVAVMLGAAVLAVVVMGRIEDDTTAQVTAVVIALAGVIASRLIHAWMLKRGG